MDALTTLRDKALQYKKSEDDEEEEEERTLLGQAVDTALIPFRIAISRPAIKVYLTTFLFFFTSCVLVSISTTAYLIFYYNYIPQIGLSQIIYLQYDTNAHPRATIPIDTSALISQQPYDIFVNLRMPRTPANLAAGNFMIDLSLLPDQSITGGALAYILNTTGDSTPAGPLAHSRRSAILPYTSTVTSLSHKLLHLPIHLLSLKDLDTSLLKIPMFERLSFPRGRANIPTQAYIEIQSQTPPTGCPSPSNQALIGVHLLPQSVSPTVSTLQIYSAELNFHARFQGLRYYVYNYRILSFLIFSSLFYGFAISSMAIAWAFITALLSARNTGSTITGGGPGRKGVKLEEINAHGNGGDSADRTIKSEETTTTTTTKLQDIKQQESTESDDEDVSSRLAALDPQALANLSSTERTFPTTGRNTQPLRYTPSSTTDPSEEAESLLMGATAPADDVTHDAGDEDEDNDAGTRGGDGVPTTGIVPLSARLGRETKTEDSDDGDETYRDSGIGTSMESDVRGGGGGGGSGSSRGANPSGLVRRRRSSSSRASGRGVSG